MSIIIRLQNLPWTANALDIRRFFQGLPVPDGGVHIVGGDKGDAFIAFSSDDDARRAMYNDNNRIHDCCVKLMLSSKTEMQNVIAVARGSGVQPGGPSGPNGGAGQASSFADRNTGGPQMGQGPQGFGGPGGNQRDSNRPGSMSSFHGGSGGQMGPTDSPDRMGGRTGSFGDNRPIKGPLGLMDEGLMGNRGPSNMDSLPGNMGRGPGINDNMNQGSNWDRPLHGNRDGFGDSFGRRNDQMGDNFGRRTDQLGDNFGRRTDQLGDNFGRRTDQVEDNFGRRNEGLGMNDRMGSQSDMMGDRLGSNLNQSNFNRDGSNFARNEGSFNDNVEPTRFSRMEPGPGNFGQVGLDRDILRDRPLSLDQGRMGNSNVGSMRGMGGLDTMRLGDIDLSERLGLDSGRRLGGSDITGNIGMGNGGMGNHPNVNSDIGPMERELNRHDNLGPMERGLMGRIDRDDLGPIGLNNMGRDRNNLDMPMIDRDRPTPFLSDGPRNLMDMGNLPQRPMGNVGNSLGGVMDMPRGIGMRPEIFDTPRDVSPMRRDPDFGVGERRDFGIRKRIFIEQDRFAFVSNMVYTVRYKDVRRFFRGCEIPTDGLKLINNNTGKRVGDAYVRFASERDLQEALKLDGEAMDGRRIRLRPCLRDEYDLAVDSYVPGDREGGHGEVGGRGTPPPLMDGPPIKRTRQDREPRKDPNENCVVLRNCPYKADKQDFRRFFAHVGIASNGGPFIETKDGRNVGCVLFKFESNKDYKEALNHQNKPLMGRNIDVVPIPKKEFDDRVAKQKIRMRDDDKREKEKEVKTKSTPVKVSNDKPIDTKEEDKKSEDFGKKFYCIKLNGLPYTANLTVIREFFSGLQIANRGIHLVKNNQGQTAGVGFVEFVTSDDCKKALGKHKEHIGKRYIEIEAIAKKNMMEMLKKEQERINARGGGGVRGIGGDMEQGNRHEERAIESGGGGGNSLVMQNLHFKVRVDDILDFFHEFHVATDSVKLRESRDGRFSGAGVISFSDPDEAARALQQNNKQPILGRPVLLQYQ